MKKLFLMGVIALGLFSFTTEKKVVEEAQSYEFDRVCVLWEHTTIIGENGSVTTSSKCLKFRDIE